MFVYIFDYVSCEINEVEVDEDEDNDIIRQVKDLYGVDLTDTCYMYSDEKLEIKPLTKD